MSNVGSKLAKRIPTPTILTLRFTIFLQPVPFPSSSLLAEAILAMQDGQFAT
jgi:hypothetical protein